MTITRVHTVDEVFGSDNLVVINSKELFTSWKPPVNAPGENDFFADTYGEVEVLTKMLGPAGDWDIHCNLFGDIRSEDFKYAAAQQKGIWLYFDLDDYTWICYKEGKAIGAFYCSTRGDLYQAGFYTLAVEPSDPRYIYAAWRNNIQEDVAKDDKWHQVSADSRSISVSIVRELLEEHSR